MFGPQLPDIAREVATLALELGLKLGHALENATGADLLDNGTLGYGRLLLSSSGHQEERSRSAEDQNHDEQSDDEYDQPLRINGP
ncbi:MAG: hypothetical protein BWY57_03528 [Betaproteobacteria bacterium ADurb.Bin341]|nr:MAG: hypothetical protein BWY57_03528 [Betaproteobacteria bacterium ADurb.Bin341]